MLDWMPPGTELVQDVSAADWILERLRPWDPSGVRLNSLAPERFDAYARIFHTARTGRTLTRWAELGAARGVALTPDVAFCEVSGLGPEDEDALSDITSLSGSLPEDMCAVLARLLRPHTRTPERYWFCLWDGNGSFWSHAHTQLRTDDLDAPGKERSSADKTAQDALLHSTPKVEAEHRRYLMFRGPLDAAAAFEPGGSYDSPNLWWPDDRSWIVVTEVDGYSSYVGARNAAIQDVIGSPDLEAIAVPHDVHTNPGPYRPRWRTVPKREAGSR